MLSLTSLPEEVLKLVMQHVPLKQRLSSCCLVSKRLHAAAVAATDALVLVKPDHLQGAVPPPCAQSAKYWITHYGQHLRTVHLGGFAMELLQLPCPNLRQLQLGSGFSVQLGPSRLHAGAMQGCTNLTRLELQCQLSDAREGTVVDGLCSLVHLQHLDVQARKDAWHPYALGGLSHATLSRMQHLTYLRFCSLSILNLLQLKSLTNLQVLHLAAAFGDEIAVGPRSVAGMEFPGSLKVLCLPSPIEAALLSMIPTGLQDLQIDCDVEGPLEGPGSFVSCMARLQHLTSFVMGPDAPDTMDGDVVWPLPCPAYSALTASSSLVRLRLHNRRGGIWQYVFPATRTLPHLTSFSVAPNEDGFTQQHPFWNHGDLVSLISCCPNLCSIDSIPVQHGAHVSGLHKLTALTHVCVTFDYQIMLLVDDLLRGLAELTQLHFLRLVMGATDELTPGRFLPLNSMTALTGLELVYNDPDGMQQWFDFVSEDRSNPDVWLQLLEHCAEDEECPGCGWPTHLQGVVQQLVKHRDQAVQLQQQVSQQQEQLAAQQQLIADLQRQLAVQQQQQQGGLCGDLQRQLHVSQQ